jgi:hypothetical protein
MHGIRRPGPLDVDNDDGIYRVVLRGKGIWRVEKSTSTHFSIRRLLLYLMETRRSRKYVLIRSRCHPQTLVYCLLVVLAKLEAPWLVHAEIARKNIPRRTPLARTILWHQSKGLVETFRSIYRFWKSGNFQASCVAFTVGDPERAKWNPPDWFRPRYTVLNWKF